MFSAARFIVAFFPFLRLADSASLNKLRLARALFDFHALSSREISVKKGDVVIIQRPVNHNWVEVEDTLSGLKVSFAPSQSQRRNAAVMCTSVMTPTYLSIFFKRTRLVLRD